MVLWVSPWCWAIWLLFQDLSLGWRSVCLLIRCAYLRGCFGCCGKIRAPCILFSLIARKRGPPWQRLREMHAFRAEAGRIFVPCIRFGVQSGDFGYIARESCQGGPLFLRRGPWNHAWGEDPANARRCVGLSAPAGSRSRKIPDMVAEDCWSERLNLAIAVLLHSKTRRAPWALSWRMMRCWELVYGYHCVG